jgi:hypothetical protein
MSQQYRSRTLAGATVPAFLLLAGSCLGLGCQSSKGMAREVSLVPPKVVRQASAEKAKTTAIPASKSILRAEK